MAVFDASQQRVCVRVVYDGVASAGKTTNLRQLAELFATQRTCEVFSPEETAGRTLYFDWLQIAAGMVCGFPLVCQVITVPGQLVLTPRRRHLLATADVVVHVCDSETNAVTRALDGLAHFDDVEAARPNGERLPLVIQANKQDQQGALSGPALLTTLSRSGVPVVEAIASDGIGVVDTFVAAVRAAVRSMQARVDRGDVRVPVQHAESAGTVLHKLMIEKVDPEWEIEMMLEEASNAFTLGGSFTAAFSQVIGEATDLRGENDGEEDDAPTTWRPERATGRAVTLPTEDVPTGFIWPAHTGRAVLRALATQPEMKATVTLDGHGDARLDVGDFLLRTAHDKRFSTSESARQALVRAARERTQLGSLLAPETVLVAQPAGEDATWLWTILPRMPTVTFLASPRDHGARGGILPAFGAAVVEALKVEAQHGMVLDLSPTAFGMAAGTMRYLGDIAAAAAATRDAGQAVITALLALADVCEDPEPAVAAIEAGLASRLSPEERAKLAHGATWAERGGRDVLRGARDRLRAAFNRGLRAA